MDNKIGTAKMSVKGQLVIPEEIREKLHLQPGDHFVVTTYNDAIVIKRLEAPTVDNFKSWAGGLINKARSQAKESKLTPKDVEQAINRVRNSRKRANRTRH